MGKTVGFDIGENSVKMVYFAGRQLKKAVCVDLPDNMVSGGRILSMDAMADFLRETAKAYGIPKAGAALSLSASEIYTREVTLPAMTEQQLVYNLPYEFHDFLTEEKSKYFFDYSMRSIERDEAGYPVKMELFACAMLKADVEDYRAMFRRAGFRLRVLTPAVCAYGALMTDHMRRTGDDTAERCIINLGHRLTRLYIYHGSTIVGQKEIELGLEGLDELIAEELGVNVHVAREYKESNYNGVLGEEYALEFYNRLAVEIMKAINFYHYNNRDRELQELYLCGGGCAIPQLKSAIGELTRLNIRPGEELLEQSMRPEQPWLYLRAIGCVNAGARGGLS